MKHLWIVSIFVFGAVVNGCGSGDPKVGDGANLSTLSEQPTGAEFISALFEAIPIVQSQGRLSSQAALSSRILARYSLSTGSSSSTHSGTAACPQGGNVSASATSNGTLVISNNVLESADFSLSSSYDNCAILLSLKGNTYKETIQGSGSGSVRVENGQGGGSASVSMTLSGDLGLAVKCNIQESGSFDFNNQDSVSTTGSCEITDSAGARLEAKDAELKDLVLFNLS